MEITKKKFTTNVVKLTLLLGVVVFLSFISFLVIKTQDANALDRNDCLSCHSQDISKVNDEGQTVSLHVSQTDLNNGVHESIDCIVCHTTDPHSSTSQLTKLTSAEKCGSCHQTEYQEFMTSIHGQQLEQGNSDVATCVDCHSPTGDAHNVVPVLDSGAPTFKANMAETCGNCHNDDELMQSYGIVEKVYETYMRSYHGKAVGLSKDDSQINAATCTNCHGAHDIKAVDDPNSPVAGMDNLTKTCEQCHQGAGVEFASGFLGHKEASPDNVPAAHYVEKGFAYLLYSVLGVGGVVLLGAIIGYSRNRWRP